MNSSITHQHLFSSKRQLLNNDQIVFFPVESLFENLSQPTKPVSFSMKRFFRILWSCDDGSFHDSLEEPAKAVEFDVEHDFTIFGSCNGLLCLFDMNHGCVLLWNPSVRLKSKKFPTLDCYEYNKCMITYRGFGYDHVNDKYKVLVHVRSFTDNGIGFGNFVTKIYTFGENSLKTIPNFPGSDIGVEWGGIFVSGTLNWVILKKGVSSNQNVIISFDLEKETYKELLLPEHDDVNFNIPRLCVSNNFLYVFCKENKTHSVLWLMKIYGVAKSWTRLIMIPHEQLWNHVQHSPHFIEPVLILENHIVLLISNKFVFYNLNNGKVDSLCINSGNYVRKLRVYQESLVSPLL